MIIEENLEINDLQLKINKGERYFKNIDVESGALKSLDLNGITFEECILAIDFQDCNLENSRFINSNLKTASFQSCKMDKSIFKDNALCDAVFKYIEYEEIFFEGNYYHSSILEVEDIINI